MGTWTKMKITDQVRFSINQVKTHVTATSLYGEQTVAISELKDKVQDRDIHPTLRKIYKDMLTYAEEQCPSS